jgi:CBS domain containing-hemolysin-like protein
MESKEHMAIVVDEYGSMRGVVTMEDIIETLLGMEIIDEKDTIVDMQKYAKERWVARQREYNIIMDLKKNK